MTSHGGLPRLTSPAVITAPPATLQVATIQLEAPTSNPNANFLSSKSSKSNSSNSSQDHTMEKIKNAIKGHRHQDDKHQHEMELEEEVLHKAAVMPGSVPVTGTYSKTEREYQAAMGNIGGARATETTTGTAGGSAIGTSSATGLGAVTEEVVAERPVAVGVAEVPVVVTEQERVVGTHEHHHEHHHAHQHSSTERVGGEICGQKTFTQVEDRPVIRERVERIVEHRPVEKQYVVETRFVGEKEMGVAGAEIIDTKHRVVDVAEPGPTCPANTGAIMNEVVEGMSHTTGTTGRV